MNFGALGKRKKKRKSTFFIGKWKAKKNLKYT